jgi:hypothetical protein
MSDDDDEYDEDDEEDDEGDEGNVLFSESLLEDEEQAEEEEEEAKNYVDSDEGLLAIIEGAVDGQSSLNRLAVTDRRIVFYPRSKGLFGSLSKASAVSLNYDQLVTVEGKKGTLLGEINVSTKENIFRFKNMAKNDVDQIADLISRTKNKVKTQQVLNPSRESALEQLKKLAELRNIGAITEEEFQEKRKKLLELI